jgi:hypothetical protein
VIDLQGILQGLLQFFDQAPNGSRAQFVNAVDANGIATPAETDRFLDVFLAIAEEMALIDSADFDVMMARRRAVGIARATRSATTIYGELVRRAEFRIEELQSRLDILRQFLADLEAKLPLIATARVWIEANAPGSQAQKDATLEALDAGVQTMEATQLAVTRMIGEVEEQIRQLGGEPV